MGSQPWGWELAVARCRGKVSGKVLWVQPTFHSDTRPRPWLRGGVRECSRGHARGVTGPITGRVGGWQLRERADSPHVPLRSGFHTQGARLVVPEAEVLPRVLGRGTRGDTPAVAQWPVRVGVARGQQWSRKKQRRPPRKETA